MNLIYELRRKSETAYWNETEAVIVVANDNVVARQLASEKCGDEGPDIWLYGGKCKITTLGVADKDIMPGVKCVESVLVNL